MVDFPTPPGTIMPAWELSSYFSQNEKQSASSNSISSVRGGDGRHGGAESGRVCISDFSIHC